MSQTFAIAVQWPDEGTPYLVHLRKPYFVASVRRIGALAVFVVNLSSEQWRASEADVSALLAPAAAYFAGAMSADFREAHFVKGAHRHEFPRYLMARASNGEMYIVEPDHPSPLVEVKEPQAKSTMARPNHSKRFDVVTQWRLVQMRKYYQQFLERQQRGQMSGGMHASASFV